MLLAEAFAFVQDRINQAVQAGDPITPQWTNLRDRLYAASLTEFSTAEARDKPTAVLPVVCADDDTPCVKCGGDGLYCCRSSKD
jgi:hypothetical protein